MLTARATAFFEENGSNDRKTVLRDNLAKLRSGASFMWDVTEGSSPLGVPVFVAHGRHDYTVPWVLWDGIPERLPNAALRVFEQSGHHPFYEESERFVAALAEWLAKLP